MKNRFTLIFDGIVTAIFDEEEDEVFCCLTDGDGLTIPQNKAEIVCRALNIDNENCLQSTKNIDDIIRFINQDCYVHHAGEFHALEQIVKKLEHLKKDKSKVTNTRKTSRFNLNS